MLSAEKLIALIDGLGGIVWEGDPETFQFSFVSARAEGILGFPLAEWLEAGFWARHTHPDDVERCMRTCREATRDGRDHTFEYRMIAADARTVWLRDIVSVRRTADGQVRLVGLTLDITIEKQQEAERLRVSRLYEALIENSSDNITMVDAAGRTVYQSAAGCDQLGVAADEMVGRNNFDLISPEDRDFVTARFNEVLATDAVVGPTRFRAYHPARGWRTLESVAKRFRADDGTTFVVSNTRDITDVIQAQAALEASEEQLAHAMKMEAVGRLAGGIAHDFNNLLTVVSGYAELLGASLGADDERAADVDEIRRAAHRASLLTRQLLAFSRKQVLRPEVLDLNTVIEEVEVLIRRLIGEDIRVSSTVAPEPLPIVADRSQLEQVLMNLAVNARDAMPLGGRLSIGSEAGDGVAVLTLEDNGCGMPPDVMRRMFEPFFTTKETGKGTGLGLATAYGIVKQSGGDIHVSSEVGKGTLFTITFPLSQGDTTPALVPDDEFRGGDETILLVEDETQVRDLVQQVLERLGYTVLVARDINAVTDLCRMHKHSLGLLLTDIVMPQVSGPEVYKRVSMVVPQLPVLYMSGYTGDKVFARGVIEDGVAFLQKPFTPQALALRVREVLDEAGRARQFG